MIHCSSILPLSLSLRFSNLKATGMVMLVPTAVVLQMSTVAMDLVLKKSRVNDYLSWPEPTALSSGTLVSSRESPILSHNAVAETTLR